MTLTFVCFFYTILQSFLRYIENQSMRHIPENYTPIYPLQQEWSNQQLAYLHSPTLERYYQQYQQANADSADRFEQTPENIEKMKGLKQRLVNAQARSLNEIRLQDHRQQPEFNDLFASYSATQNYNQIFDRLNQEFNSIKTRLIEKFQQSRNTQEFKNRLITKPHGWLLFKDEADQYDCIKTELKIAQLNYQFRLDSLLFYLRARALVRDNAREFTSDYYYQRHCCHNDFFSTWLMLSLISQPRYNVNPGYYGAVPTSSSHSSSSSSYSSDNSKLLGAAVVLFAIAFVLFAAWGFWKVWKLAGEGFIKNTSTIKRTSMLVTGIIGLACTATTFAFIPLASVNTALFAVFSVTAPIWTLITAGTLIAITTGLGLGCLGYLIGKAIVNNSTTLSEFNTLDVEYIEKVDTYKDTLRELNRHKDSIESGIYSFRNWPVWDNIPKAPAPISDDLDHNDELSSYAEISTPLNVGTHTDVSALSNNARYTSNSTSDADNDESSFNTSNSPLSIYSSRRANAKGDVANKTNSDDLDSTSFEPRNFT